MLVTGCVVASSIVMAVFLTGPYIQKIEAVKDWQDKRRWYSMGLYEYILEDYPALFPSMKDHSSFIFEYGRALNMEGRYTESLDILSLSAKSSNDPMFYNIMGNNYKAIGEYDTVAEAYLNAYYIIPNRMYPLYLLAKMYSETGDRESAAYYARKVVDMIPKVQSSATDDMQREMKDVLLLLE